MGSSKQTAVNLNKAVQQIKDDLAPIYGLKNILSAGLVLFNRLSADEQKKIVADSHIQGEMAEADKLGPFLGAVADMLEKDAAGPRVLSEKEQNDLDRIIQRAKRQGGRSNQKGRKNAAI